MLIGVGVLFGVFCWLAILAGGKFVIQAWRELRSLRSFQDCPRSAINWCDDGNCGGSDAGGQTSRGNATASAGPAVDFLPLMARGHMQRAPNKSRERPLCHRVSALVATHDATLRSGGGWNAFCDRLKIPWGVIAVRVRSPARPVNSGILMVHSATLQNRAALGGRDSSSGIKNSSML